ncbi:hypothetical protein SEA_SCHMIDT_9 [Gordonia phage Schmidt]|uniref:Uncharacterized protein n=1 Tax=Gordonia phage Schmidt TaxID=2301697 RepID=A0A385E064_9CAUD|nr:hypothetical protein KDJ59_gp09 [Gordonia phage Schmidt]AXQ65131.1 hypothetical protein SEA_SCHMIDT_9 [Gordonia phage Schmidt]
MLKLYKVERDGFEYLIRMTERDAETKYKGAVLYKPARVRDKAAEVAVPEPVGQMPALEAKAPQVKAENKTRSRSKRAAAADKGAEG